MITEEVIALENKKKTEVPIWEKAALTFEETAVLSNIGIGKLRRMAKDPNCTFVLNVGSGKQLIKREEFLIFLSKNIEI